MQRLGLALSGGGLRATLYHLGVVRLLRDAGILSKITHITTVSGGSILGAHLALNWDRYGGTPEEFDEAAAEIIRFVQLDVRNRIVRRFPVTALANRVSSMLFQGQRRQWTRAGLLERYYERFLYGETSLSQLPDHPRLHILATNLSEGCLCSFNRNGLLMQRRIAGRRDRFERVQAGLATVPMAVAASSCFPGFFPPVEITAAAGRPIAPVPEHTVDAAAPVAESEIQPRRMPSGPKGPGRFGAGYCKLKYYEQWDALWRVDEHPDVLVRFDQTPVRVVFWRGSRYSPASGPTSCSSACRPRAAACACSATCAVTCMSGFTRSSGSRSRTRVAACPVT